jgi:hypothetical protein
MSALLAGTLHALSTHDTPTKDPARDRQPPSQTPGVGRLRASADSDLASARSHDSYCAARVDGVP